VAQANFDVAIGDFAAALGEDAAFNGERLSEYVDPYEVPETPDSERKVPSTTVCPTRWISCRQ
jgi:hypothetical protein